MSRIQLWNRGSKRRVRQIRWERNEIVSAILMGCLITVLGFLLAEWLAAYQFD